MNDQYYRFALNLIDKMSNEELKASLEKAGFEVTPKVEAPVEVQAPETITVAKLAHKMATKATAAAKKKRKTKQDKLDQEARTKILSSLNDFLSELGDISNDTGYEIPDLHYNSLACLHKDLSDERKDHE